MRSALPEPADPPELDEWFLHWILARAAKHGMLEDMGDSGSSRAAAYER